jgi:hypothetical protein
MQKIKNIEKAAERIKKAVKNNERIILYGDSDLDGISSTVVLGEAIKNIGGTVDCAFFPDRENDGYGINLFGEVCAVQPKYRSNTKGLLTSEQDNLNSFITEALLEKDIQPSKNYRHFVFTTAKGLHYYTDHEKFRGMVKCYGYDDIRSLVDNNLHFWNFIREQILQFKKTLEFSNNISSGLQGTNTVGHQTKVTNATIAAVERDKCT